MSPVRPSSKFRGLDRLTTFKTRQIKKKSKHIAWTKSSYSTFPSYQAQSPLIYPSVHQHFLSTIEILNQEIYLTTLTLLGHNIFPPPWIAMVVTWLAFIIIIIIIIISRIHLYATKTCIRLSNPKMPPEIHQLHLIWYQSLPQTLWRILSMKITTMTLASPSTSSFLFMKFRHDYPMHSLSHLPTTLFTGMTGQREKEFWRVIDRTLILGSPKSISLLISCFQALTGIRTGAHELDSEYGTLRVCMQKRRFSHGLQYSRICHK